MKRSKVEISLVSSNGLNIPDTCVAACVFPRKSDGYPHHAALAVCVGGHRTFFHFDAENITEEPFGDYVFIFKEFDSIPPFEANAFRVICNSAIRNPPPTYHYLFDGSHYKEGTFAANNGSISYHMTCVGFCLAILKEWFEEDYIKFTDWTCVNSMWPEDVEEQTRQLREIYSSTFSDEELQENMRRIKPIELISSAFYKNIPVGKVDTDKISPRIRSIVMDWFTKGCPRFN